MKKHLLLTFIFLVKAAALSGAETNHAAQLKLLTEQRDNAVKEVIKPIDAKYHELLGNLQKSAAAASDFETVIAIQNILKGSKTAPTMEDYFPAGSKWTGTWATSRFAEQKSRYKLLNTSPDRAMLEFTHSSGEFYLELQLSGNTVRVESIRGVDADYPISFTNIKVSGPMTDKEGRRYLEMNGQWTVGSPKDASVVPGVRFVLMPD